EHRQVPADRGLARPGPRSPLPLQALEGAEQVIDLTMPDTQESKFDLIFDLSEELDFLPPVYIISHKRSSHLPTLSSIPALRSRATVVVAHSEEDDYRAALPDVDVAVIPEGYGGHDRGLGRAKQYCLDMATLLRQDTTVLVGGDPVAPPLH